MSDIVNELREDDKRRFENRETWESFPSDDLGTRAAAEIESLRAKLEQETHAVNTLGPQVAMLETLNESLRAENITLKLAVDRGLPVSGVANLILQSQEFDREAAKYMEEIRSLHAELAEAKAHSIKNIPFYRLSIHSLRDSIVRLMWAYNHSEGCERAKEENKTNFLPTCTCVDSDAIEYGAQTLYNTEQVAKAIEALSAMQEGK